MFGHSPILNELRLDCAHTLKKVICQLIHYQVIENNTNKLNSDIRILRVQLT